MWGEQKKKLFFNGEIDAEKKAIAAEDGKVL